MTAVGAPRRRAREVLKEYGVPGLPIDIDAVVRGRGIRVQEVPMIARGVYAAF